MEDRNARRRPSRRVAAACLVALCIGIVLADAATQPFAAAVVTDAAAAAGGQSPRWFACALAVVGGALSLFVPPPVGLMAAATWAGVAARVCA
jgi:hypothetical protein